jgi:hypothetical protein
MSKSKHDQDLQQLIAKKEWKKITTACEEYELDVRIIRHITRIFGFFASDERQHKAKLFFVLFSLTFFVSDDRDCFNELMFISQFAAEAQNTGNTPNYGVQLLAYYFLNEL